jgi:hypothetical protein
MTGCANFDHRCQVRFWLCDRRRPDLRVREWRNGDSWNRPGQWRDTDCPEQRPGLASWREVAHRPGAASNWCRRECGRRGAAPGRRRGPFVGRFDRDCRRWISGAATVHGRRAIRGFERRCRGGTGRISIAHVDRANGRGFHPGLGREVAPGIGVFAGRRVRQAIRWSSKKNSSGNA